MPLLFESQIEASIKVAVWQIDETLEWFQNQLSPSLSIGESHELTALTPRKQLEWYAGRWLLHITINKNKRLPIIKDEHGKPHIKDIHISISHSADKVAVIIAQHKPVGIDIQYFTSKIERIQTRFLRPDELACLAAKNHIEQLHVFWGAKESLYKAYGKKELDFRKHIYVASFDYQIDGGIIKAHIQKTELIQNYTIHYKTLAGFSLVFAIQH